MESLVVDRSVVRVVVINEQSDVLLVCENEPSQPVLYWWIVPGGGIETGETPEEAAARELQEETGLTLRELGPVIWSRFSQFVFGGRECRQRETFFCAKSEHSLKESLNPKARWWSACELGTIAASLEPTNIPELRALALSQLNG
jgi:8-oxo-dGTP pyrophosphatase MutT (NUDIX family)